jgi:hypothetical protein
VRAKHVVDATRELFGGEAPKRNRPCVYFDDRRRAPTAVAARESNQQEASDAKNASDRVLVVVHAEVLESDAR